MSTFNFSSFEVSPVVGILRNFTFQEVRLIADAYEQAGLSTLEITLNSPDAFKCISYLSARNQNLNIGAGTVCSLSDMSNALDAGASFIVTPVCNLDMIRKAKESRIPIFPGAFTPTEIYQAWEAGASAVKVFPASTMGPKYIKEVLAPLGQIKLLPTGGIHAGNMKEYFLAGAKGVGMGSALVGKKEEVNDRDALLQRMIKIRKLITEITKGISP